ncbi:FtsW/RodA/SpoVE family cell cycle protein [Kiritimatiellaeota bacterium B1221]|nr:FtsW/RodA/SpoVE family cell cycle protein [Kiritimatiellaeota bacterium B1221]
MTAKKTSSASDCASNPPSQRLGFGGVFLLLAVGMLLVLGARANAGEFLHLSDVLPYVFWAVSAGILVLGLRLASYGGSPVLPELMLLLSALGVLVRSRMEGSVEGVGNWSLFIQPLGFVWLWLAWNFSRKGRILCFRALWPLAFLISLAVVGGLILLGSRFRGAFYGPGGLTPSELLKLFVPLALAGFFAAADQKWLRRGFWNPPIPQSAQLLMAWGLLCGLLVLQRDLGLVVLLSFMLVVMLISVTRSWSWGVLLAGAMAGGGWLVWKTMDHGARRLQAWLDPFADPTGSGWQVLQGLSGLYAGGLTGTGLGAGAPERLPIAGSDFVYAVYGEELGYIGCVLLLILFALLLRRSAEVANIQSSPFAGLLATGLTAILAVQVLVNIAGVVTLLPITGITLPYISQGGSSIWVTSVQFGLLLGMAEPGEIQKKAKSKGKSKVPSRKKSAGSRK